MNKKETTGLKHFNGSKAFIEYSNDMYDIYKTIEEYNPNEKRKTLTFFDDMIADMLSNIKFNPMVTELTLKLSISLVFIAHYILLSYFTIPKNIRPNSTHYFIIKIPKKQELQQITFNHS